MEWDNHANGHHTPLPINSEEAGELNLEDFDATTFDGAGVDLGGLFDQQQVAEVVSQRNERRGSQKRSSRARSSIRTKRRGGELSLPKKPLSAYNIFFKTIRPKLIQEFGGNVRFDELGRIVGERWRDTSHADRKVYEKKADEDVLRYRKEMNVYNEERRKILDERRLEREESESMFSHAPLPPRVMRVARFPPLPPGHYMGPAPANLNLEHRGQQVELASIDGYLRRYTVEYKCFKVKRSDLDMYTRHLVQQGQAEEPMPSRGYQPYG